MKPVHWYKKRFLSVHQSIKVSWTQLLTQKQANWKLQNHLTSENHIKRFDSDFKLLKYYLLVPPSVYSHSILERNYLPINLQLATKFALIIALEWNQSFLALHHNFRLLKRLPTLMYGYKSIWTKEVPRNLKQDKYVHKVASENKIVQVGETGSCLPVFREVAHHRQVWIWILNSRVR